MKTCVDCKKKFIEKEGYTWVRCWDCYTNYIENLQDGDWGALDDDFTDGC